MASKVIGFTGSDTYEPGSAFKIITTASAFEEHVVTVDDTFFCPGYKRVEDRIIRCHKAGGHGSQTFVDGIKNSCNPVFMEIGARVGNNEFWPIISNNTITTYDSYKCNYQWRSINNTTFRT